jgi:hypothetical protein
VRDLKGVEIGIEDGESESSIINSLLNLIFILTKKEKRVGDHRKDEIGRRWWISGSALDLWSI